MGTRIVSRSGKEKPCVSNELPQPIEKKCLTVLGHETEVWIFPTDDTDSSLSETEEEEDDESDDDFPMKQFYIGTTPTNSAMGDLGAVPSLETKELLFRSIATLLSKNGLSDSADVVRKEADIKEDGGATPPDIEGVLLEFLKKGESNAQEEILKLNQLASSLKALSLSISPDTCDQKDDIFSMYISEASEVANSPVEFLCDKYCISIKGMHESTVVKDVVKFFGKASITVKAVRVKLGKKPRLNFRNELKMSASVRFRSPEDTKKAYNMSGTYMEIRKDRGGSVVYMDRVSNDKRVLCISGIEGNLKDRAFTNELLESFQKIFNKFKVCRSWAVCDSGACYVLVKVKDKSARDMLKDLNGRYFMQGGFVVREANLKPIIFETVFRLE
ncbi:unnamed protein product [Eruca vesicaria subsp. sativa]|uniref:RRM domain-containing protein n=1 Tax=Eruca vesicaria subsp. sativa TaxID=29727 RepID=A0ABC8JGL8_ERUVS|nr:unnamed protein product [Eruca vesicaria subsp. sativa]